MISSSSTDVLPCVHAFGAKCKANQANENHLIYTRLVPWTILFHRNHHLATLLCLTSASSSPQRYGFYASDPRWLLDLVDRPEALDGTCASTPSISSTDTGYTATFVSACGNYVASISDDRLLEVTPRIPVGPLPEAMAQKESVVA
jgi:hypothetical protein